MRPIPLFLSQPFALSSLTESSFLPPSHRLVTGLGIYVTAMELELGDWREIHDRLDPFVTSWLFTMAIADVVITAALCESTQKRATSVLESRH